VQVEDAINSFEKGKYTMHCHNFNFIFSTLFTYIFFSISPNAFARVETGAKAGFDSNIDRAVEGGISDSYMTGFLCFTRESGEGTETDWSLSLSNIYYFIGLYSYGRILQKYFINSNQDIILGIPS
jgi:hypothetical protein